MDARRRPAMPAWNRPGSLVLACLLSYGVAHLVVMDIVRLPGPASGEATALGQIMALALLPVLIVLGFGAHARHVGLFVVGGCGLAAALVGAVLS
ncbi:hypothetical protein [Komagataeibacter rhaeticus]|uniref:hypothetical protein n=1 Tax=Komagataeibacter rhaeticus TaxID=215221 RepID=UPI00030A2963|nr:hypothetical protein [Komagataeibacter rhaeticus]QOC47634.1 hypothetical protein ICJ78_06035 [Komagataeibacter rhaeticus]WPP23017.1 hypothetical protein SCD25_05915 [Komagataeibacter rhaeticus]SAY48235.1 hypothetical protein KRIGEM_01181 [Komagataeibacter rhaeticus]